MIFVLHEYEYVGSNISVTYEWHGLSVGSCFNKIPLGLGLSPYFCILGKVCFRMAIEYFRRFDDVNFSLFDFWAYILDTSTSLYNIYKISGKWKNYFLRLTHLLGENW